MQEGHMAEWDSGNIRIRPTMLPEPGRELEWHYHPFAHTGFHFTGAARGKVRLKDGTIYSQDFYSRQLSFIMHKLGRDMSANESHSLIYPNTDHTFEAIQPTKVKALEMIAHLDEAGVRDLLAEVISMPSTVWCTFAHRDPQGQIIQNNIGWHHAYSGWSPEKGWPSHAGLKNG